MPWPSTPPTAAHRAAFADAEPRRSGCRRRAGRRPRWPATRRRPVHRRRRLHRAVGGAATPRSGIRGATSYCSRPRPPASAPAGATAASCRSLTHGIDNGLARFAEEMQLLERLGARELRRACAPIDALRDRLRLRAHRRPAGHRRLPGTPRLEEDESCGVRPRVMVLDGAAMRAEVASPTYLRRRLGPHRRGDRRPGQAGLRPARARAGRCPRASSTPPCTTSTGRHRVLTASGRCARARSCSPPAPIHRCCGSGASRAGLRLRARDRAARPRSDSIGWKHRQGFGDGGNQFHYYRLTADNRILSAARTPSTASAARSPAPGRARPDFHHAGPALLPDVPAARGHALHPPLGRRHRHLLPLLGLLRHRARRPPRLRHRLHRPRRRRRPLRRPRRRSTSSTAATPRRRACATSAPSPPVPARAAPVRGDPVHPQPPRGRRP